MEITISLTAKEVEVAIKDYILKQNMNLSPTEISINTSGMAFVKCAKVVPVVPNNHYVR